LTHKAIIFSYTSIETFVNLSIPESYNYNSKKNKEGITEIYDKNGIERWLPLAVKLKNILVDIYNTPEIQKQSFWQDFLTLEKYRDQIIHQKSSDRTILYENYFQKDIYKNIKVSTKIVDFLELMQNHKVLIIFFGLGQKMNLLMKYPTLKILIIS
ncbi:MAG TPA: hypothetical protein VIG45_01450, partial [Erysipelothrix sp.]